MRKGKRGARQRRAFSPTTPASPLPVYAPDGLNGDLRRTVNAEEAFATITHKDFQLLLAAELKVLNGMAERLHNHDLRMMTPESKQRVAAPSTAMHICHELKSLLAVCCACQIAQMPNLGRKWCNMPKTRIIL